MKMKWIVSEKERKPLNLAEKFIVRQMRLAGDSSVQDVQETRVAQVTRRPSQPAGGTT